MFLREVLPELLADVVGALVREGRGGVADQLSAATLHSWSFDEFAQMTYLRLSATQGREAAQQTISFFDDIGVDIDLDQHGRVLGLDVAGYEDILARLDDMEPGGAG
jgi:hypothetical protein